MNFEKIEKNNELDFDVLVEKINQKIAKILGKKSNNKLPRQDETSNKTFIAIIVVILLFLWFSTGFYYLGENQAGVVLTNGKISRVINGIKVGFVLPYPFSDVEIVDTSVSDFIRISKDDALDDYTSLSKELVPVSINAKFSYQVANPKLVFLNILQKNNNLNDVVKLQIWQELHNYIAKNTKDDIAKKNLTVMSIEVKNMADQKLANLGLSIAKFQIEAINYSGNKVSVPVYVGKSEIKEKSTEPLVEMPAIAEKILKEANIYHEDKVSETKLNINKFNQLLPQYLKDPDGITMQMYYDMLEKVPVQKDNDYQLLNLKLSDVLLKKDMVENKVTNIPASNRDFNRDVTRSRELGER